MEQNILTPYHRELLAAIAKDTYLTSSFYFTGGTALSLYYLTHRYSEDLDFFSQHPLDPIKLEDHARRVFRAVQANNVELTTLHGQHTYDVRIGTARIKVDFAYYPFEPMGTFLKKGNLRVASILDIAVNKVHAITTRKRGRDFVDLYGIMRKEGFTTRELLSNYQLKFDVHIPPTELAKHYAGVLDALDQPRFLGVLPWKKIEQFFLTKAKSLNILA